jgi:membrane protein DedA with SNARE-associated domain
MFDIDGVILMLQQNPQWIAWVLFIAAFIESFAIIGIFVPGVVLIAIASGMAASAEIHIVQVLIITFLGSCIADISSYAIGRKLSRKIDRVWPFISHPDWLLKGKEFFKSYGILGVFIGRFIGPIRPVMPITAGSMNMNAKHFIGIDLLSGMIWAPLYTFPAYFAGKIVTENTSNLPLISGLLLIAILVIVIVTKYYKK